jgi:hypothetical protein
MKSSLHGDLDVLIYPVREIPVTVGGRADLCTVRGVVMGHQINTTITLDVNTGEVLLFSPDLFVGAFRLGDLITAHVMGQMARAQQEERHAAQAH